VPHHRRLGGPASRIESIRLDQTYSVHVFLDSLLHCPAPPLPACQPNTNPDSQEEIFARGEINRAKRDGEWIRKQQHQPKGKRISSTNSSESSTTTRSCEDPILPTVSFQSDFFPPPLSQSPIRSWRRRDEVGFLHPTQLHSLLADGTNKPQQFWCSGHKLAVSTDALPDLYRAARRAHSDAALKTTPSPSASAAALIMAHSRALLILCPDLLTAWNSR
jgi:hypothetical protein